MRRKSKEEKLKDIKALEESIEHWEYMRNMPLIDVFQETYLKNRSRHIPGPVGCACCSLQNERYATRLMTSLDSVCKGCPIEQYTGKTQCEETPFYKADGDFYVLADELNREVTTKVGLFSPYHMLPEKKLKSVRLHVASLRERGQLKQDADAWRNSADAEIKFLKDVLAELKKSLPVKQTNTK